MSKRGADKELTDRNWDDEEEPEDVRMSLSNSVLMKCYESTLSPSFWDLISSEIDCHSLPPQNCAVVRMAQVWILYARKPTSTYKILKPV